jgi:hypothetical protein
VLFGTVVVVVLLGVEVVVVLVGALVVVLLGVVVLVVTLVVVVFVVPFGVVVVVVVAEFSGGAVVVVEFDGEVPELASVVVVKVFPDVPPAPDVVGDDGVEPVDDVVVVDDDSVELPAPTDDVPGVRTVDSVRPLPDESPDAEVVRSEATATVVGTGAWCVTCAVPTATAPAKLIETAAVRTAATPTCASVGTLPMNGSDPSQATGPAAARSRPMETSRNARTTVGSKWVPAQARSSARAAWGDMAGL